jgi:hypothetical protein
MSKRDSLILECRYYAGEKDNPFAQKLDANEVDKSNLTPPECMKYEYTIPPDKVNYLHVAAKLWFYEHFWVDEYEKENTKDWFEANEYYANDLKDFEPFDGTPIELKALLWNRYEHWTSGRLEDFKQWYLKYYQSRPTNRQRRAEERKKTLIPMCRYYKGEAECPQKMKDNSSLFWDYERHWVEALSYSYHRGEEWRKTVEKEHLEAFAKKHNIPATLVGLLFNRFMHWSSGYETTEDFCNWMQEHYL